MEKLIEKLSKRQVKIRIESGISAFDVSGKSPSFELAVID
jgi:hypothetical protein